jgi:photosystem II stability/assembly factor-like uncharacterized protein
MKPTFRAPLVSLIVLALLGSASFALERPTDPRLARAGNAADEPRGLAAAPPGTRTLYWEPTGGIDGGYVASLATTARGTLLAGTEGGLFRSVDGGESWQEPGGFAYPCCNYSIPALAATATTVYVGTWGGGVLRSDDDGETWAPTAAIPNEGYPIASALAACRYGETVYAGGNFGVVISLDGGASWVPVNDGLAPGVWVKKLALHGTVLYAMLDDGIYRLDPTELVWGPWNEGLYGTTGQQSLDLVDDALFLATHAGGVFHLDCDDTEWVAMNEGLWSTGVDVVTEAGDRLYAGIMGDAVFRWDPFANQWNWIGTGMWNGDVRTMTGRGLEPYAGTYGAGVFRFDTVDETWSRRSAGLRAPLMEALVAEGATIHAGLFGGGVYASNDNGDSWSPMIDGLGHVFVLALARDLDDNVYAGTWNGVWKLPSQEAVWEPAGLQGNGVFALVNEASVLYAGTLGSGVQRSIDGGQSWAPVGTGLPPDFTWSVERLGTALYAAIRDYGVYRLPDGATDWEQINAGLPGLNPWCLEASDGALFAGLDAHGVFRWNPGTTSWEATGLQGSTIFCLADAGTGLLAGSYGALYLTGDGGETWSNENQGLKPWSAVLALAAGEEYLFTGLASAGVWRTPRESGAVDPAPDAAPEAPLQGIAVRPNPFLQGASIAFRLDREQDARLAVYDASGRRVATVLSGVLPAGAHRATWDGTTAGGGRAAAGVYLVRLETEAGERTAATIRLR